MKKKTPTAQGSRGMEKLAGDFRTLNRTTTYHVQSLIARYHQSIEVTAIIAALAFGGGHG